MTQVNNCPFCKQRPAYLEETKIQKKNYFFMHCYICGGKGPTSLTEEGAIQAWNGATISAPASPEWAEKVREALKFSKRFINPKAMKKVDGKIKWGDQIIDEALSLLPPAGEVG